MGAFKRNAYTDMAEDMRAAVPGALTAMRLRCECGLTLIYGVPEVGIFMADYQRLQGTTIVGGMGKRNVTGYAGSLRPVPAKAERVKCGDCGRLHGMPDLPQVN